EECRPTLLRYRDFAHVQTVSLVLERLARERLTDREEAEVTRLGIGRLPERHLLRNRLRPDTDRAVLLKRPGILGPVCARQYQLIERHHALQRVAAAQGVVGIGHVA